MDILQTLFTIGITFIGSTAVFGFFQFLITRRDKKKDKQQEILDKINQISAREDERDARMARTNILRFEDEVINGMHHSREYYRSVLEDLDRYETYCAAHQNFRNSYTVEAAVHIRKVYAGLVEAGEFKIKEA